MGLPEAEVPQPRIPNAPTLLQVSGLGCSPFARRYSGNRCCFLFLGVLRWFTSPGSPPTTMYSWWDVHPKVDGLPHSGIPGSQAACASPGLIAACHALHRQDSPRHPLHALSSLAINFKFSKSDKFLAYILYRVIYQVSRVRIET